MILFSRVVTGVRFSREGSIICVQIKQGKLLPGGEIEENSEEWMDCDVRDEYVVLSQYYNHIDLDDVIERSDSIVTGNLLKSFLHIPRKKS